MKIKAWPERPVTDFDELERGKKFESKVDGIFKRNWNVYVSTLYSDSDLFKGTILFVPNVNPEEL